MDREEAFWIWLTRKLIVGAFRLMWFLARVAWWLGLFAILSIGAGIIGLVRLVSTRGTATDSHEIGHYSEDGERWWDQRSGRWYQSSLTDREYCHVEAACVGTYWRRTALSRLLKMGVIQRYRFFAVSDGSSADEQRVVAISEFPMEARYGITLDHLDPARAADDQYNLAELRKWAQAGLVNLGQLLADGGWQPVGRLEYPWYATQYTRPAIRWSEPVSTGLTEAPASSPG